MAREVKRAGQALDQPRLRRRCPQRRRPNAWASISADASDQEEPGKPAKGSGRREERGGGAGSGAQAV